MALMVDLARANRLMDGGRVTMAPDRSRPGRIAFVAGDDVKMQLIDDIAERCRY